MERDYQYVDSRSTPGLWVLAVVILIVVALWWRAVSGWWTIIPGFIFVVLSVFAIAAHALDRFFCNEDE